MRGSKARHLRVITESVPCPGCDGKTFGSKGGPTDLGQNIYLHCYRGCKHSFRIDVYTRDIEDLGG